MAPLAGGWLTADEDTHPPGAEPAWHETWTFDGWTTDGLTGVSTALVLWPLPRRAWYWAALVRPGMPLVHLADLDLRPPRVGLELRAEGLWVSHVCEAPFEQWTVANEAYAVALDDPADALGRAHGTPVPVAFDLEWYASAPVTPISVEEAAGCAGYRQRGEVHGIVELQGGPMALEGPAERAHWWGTDDPWLPADDAWPPPGFPAPVRLVDAAGSPFALERVLTPRGWREARRPL